MISGALNPNSSSAIDHSNIVYESIRHQSTDVEKISRNTGFSFEQVSLIKQYIFFGTHILNGSVGRFEPDYMMAESWRRLSSKDARVIQAHDVIMLHHELLEIQYIIQGNSQSDAHYMSSQKYDYASAAKKFYGLK